MSENHSAIESTMTEPRVFPPNPALAKSAWIQSRQQYDQMYRESIDNPDKFWGGIASELHWFSKWNKTVEWNLPDAKWFVGGKTNMAYNCLDHQVAHGRGDKTAILWEGEPTQQGGGGYEIKKVTYKQLLDDVCRFPNGLKPLGLKKGGRVTIYMPMVPEAALAMLPCARLGIAHSVIFGGFSSQAIVDRVEDAESHVIITADGGYCRGQPVPLKANVDAALTKTNRVEKVIVLDRTTSFSRDPRGSAPVNMVEGRDIWWHALIANQSATCPAEPMDSEDL